MIKKFETGFEGLWVIEPNLFDDENVLFLKKNNNKNLLVDWFDFCDLVIQV